MPHRKITAFASAASAQASTVYPVVSGGNANKIITQHTVLQSLGVPQYVEGTCRATATVAVLPPNSTIFDIYVKALVESSVGAGGTNIEIGRIDSKAYFGEILVSANQFYRMAGYSSFQAPTNINRFQRTSGAVVAAAPTASACASFVVGIGYFRT